MTREEAAVFMRKVWREAMKGSYAEEAYEIAIKALEEQQWIPCSETTDIPDCEVLCCDMRGEMIVGYLDRDDESNTGWGAESDSICLMDVVAYMPLPEPWRGEEEWPN